MAVSDIIAQVRQALFRNELEKAIHLLQSILPSSGSLTDQLLIISARRHRLEEQIRAGLIRRDDAEHEQNHLISGILSICNQVEIDQQQQNGPQHHIQGLFSTQTTSHPLLQFPIGPMVEFRFIPRSIIEAFAQSVKETEAHFIIEEANAYRLTAASDSQQPTTIKMFNLPPPKSVSPMQFWTEALMEAGLHGPRMLASLLHFLPDERLSQQTKQDKHTLLQQIRNT